MELFSDRPVDDPSRCLANKNASTIILGDLRASQLQDNLAALSHKSRLMSDVLDRIDSIVGNKLEAARRF